MKYKLMTQDAASKAVAGALQRGKLVSLTMPPMKMRLHNALSQHLEQGGEGLIPFDKAVDTAFDVFNAAVAEVLTESE